jgi:hypothetical protein
MPATNFYDYQPSFTPIRSFKIHIFGIITNLKIKQKTAETIKAKTTRKNKEKKIIRSCSGAIFVKAAAGSWL